MTDQPLPSTEPTPSADDEFEAEIHHSPPWRRAVAELIDSGKHSFGDLVPHDELTQALGMQPLTGLVRPVVMEQWKLRRLQQVQALEDFLLLERRMCLSSIHGLGYKILEPARQTEFALTRGRRDLRKAMRELSRRLHHVEHSRLTDEQSRANVDALGRLAILKSVMNPARRRLFDGR